ncbi:hypothetical protein Pcinc_027980 [Petrolisthes cinctipes]|uniref:Uncharacterized protein n=1 Tax=Petrolisthes cinctipes TaxID=88211 RepID=A0AAE1KA01_PETCI|nr:hypothetical protein Pcinc_027980 [Petrolisthes cinctipes]
MSSEELETSWCLANLVMGVVKRIEAPLTRLSGRVGREVVRLAVERVRRGVLKGSQQAFQYLQEMSSQVKECELVLGWDDRMPNFTHVLQDYNQTVQTLLQANLS